MSERWWIVLLVAAALSVLTGVIIYQLGVIRRLEDYTDRLRYYIAANDQEQFKDYYDLFDDPPPPAVDMAPPDYRPTHRMGK